MQHAKTGTNIVLERRHMELQYIQHTIRASTEKAVCKHKPLLHDQLSQVLDGQCASLHRSHQGKSNVGGKMRSEYQNGLPLVDVYCTTPDTEYDVMKML